MLTKTTGYEALRGSSPRRTLAVQTVNRKNSAGFETRLDRKRYRGTSLKGNTPS